MRLLFMGPQGSGKGTQAKKIGKYLKIPHISTGDLFRGADGELGNRIRSYIDVGHLVPDQLTLQILQKRLEKSDTKKGFILDGYPRNIDQAKSLEKIAGIDKLIVLNLSEEESVRRLSGRVVCEKCSAGYNNLTDPPRKERVCDKCGSGLIQRDDDKPEAIRLRLDTYQERTKPVIDYYGNKGVEILQINGEDTIDNIYSAILKGLNA